MWKRDTKTWNGTIQKQLPFSCWKSWKQWKSKFTLAKNTSLCRSPFLCLHRWRLWSWIQTSTATHLLTLQLHDHTTLQYPHKRRTKDSAMQQQKRHVQKQLIQRCLFHQQALQPTNLLHLPQTVSCWSKCSLQHAQHGWTVSGPNERILFYHAWIFCWHHSSLTTFTQPDKIRVD